MSYAKNSGGKGSRVREGPSPVRRETDHEKGRKKDQPGKSGIPGEGSAIESLRKGTTGSSVHSLSSLRRGGLRTTSWVLSLPVQTGNLGLVWPGPGSSNSEKRYGGP